MSESTRTLALRCGLPALLVLMGACSSDRSSALENGQHTGGGRDDAGLGGAPSSSGAPGDSDAQSTAGGGAAGDEMGVGGSSARGGRTSTGGKTSSGGTANRGGTSSTGSGGRSGSAGKGGASASGGTTTGAGGKCMGVGTMCDSAQPACCDGLICVSSTGPEYAGCREPCTTATDCASGCCIPFANIPDKGFCGEASLCQCGMLDADCGGVHHCCDGFTCTTYDSTNRLACRPKCTKNSDCSTNCCIAIPTTPDSACFMASWCGK